LCDWSFSNQLMNSYMNNAGASCNKKIPSIITSFGKNLMYLESYLGKSETKGQIRWSKHLEMDNTYTECKNRTSMYYNSK
jgi:hypothetical protein